MEDPNGAQNNDVDQLVESMSAAMPPSMERGKQMSADELVRELNRIPLFMTSLDEGDGDGGENVMLEAIKALAYEGTRAEVAANFKDQGNEAARAKLWSDAREFYTKAILTLRGQAKTHDAPEDPDVKVVEIDEEAEAAKERELEESSLANRALCNLEMKNYGSCNRDCAATLQLNPRNVKAWYRAASACLALDKIPEALDACRSGLKFDVSNHALKVLEEKVEKRQKYLTDLEGARIKREQKARNENATLVLALRERNIAVRKTDEPPEMEDAAMKLADANDAKSTLSFPVLLLYPLHAQTDFIKTFAEDETLSHHLEYILPVPWDEKQEYTTTNEVDCYMETKQGGLIKAGKNLTLLKILGSGKVEIMDGLVRVFVVPKLRANEWIEQFKLRRGKQ